jgi:hypothetical protein
MKTQVGTIFKPDGQSVTVRPHGGKKFSLAELQSFVEGHIELVRMKRGNGRGTMYVNEEGKLNGMPQNEAATEITDIEGDIIVGPAIIVRIESH